MKIALVGYDTEGKASYEYFQSQGQDITIHDQSTEIVVPPGVKSVLGKNYLNNLDQYDLIVRTAGLSPKKLEATNPGILSKTTTLINEFIKASPTKHIIGITGTKGKGTTSTLTAKMLQAVGKDVHLGGNIGVPPLTFLNKLTPKSWVVLELSSFQLIDLSASPSIAVCLMVTPEHLDWHLDLDEYLQSKSQLFRHQSPEDIAIYFANSNLSQQIASSSPGQKIPYFIPPGAYINQGTIMIDDQVICRTSDLKLLGKHNWQNVCAAVTAAWQVAQDVTAYHSVLTSFRGLEHRLEFVREVNHIRFYNDTYATGLQATIAAIEAIDGKKVMILGGYDRMSDLSNFASYASEHQEKFRTLLLIGASSKRLAAALQAVGFTNYVLKPELPNIGAIVHEAYGLAQSGDAVVLSPGFASFDMFKNFTERGNQFKATVNNL
jgi:UDP-N-acetylmuramoylalanine--D-glutamate ligase